MSAATAPPATTAAVRTVRGRPCPLCEAPAGDPCQQKPAGDHLARFLDAYTAGQLTKPYMSRTLGELVVIYAASTVIPAQRGGAL